MRKSHNLIGSRFERLIVVSEVERTEAHATLKGNLWFCQCDCGNTRVTNTSCLEHGLVKSCGCMKREQGGKNRREYGESSFYMLYRSYMKKADARGYGFDLSQEQFREITKSRCYYCGRPPFCTIDRKDHYGSYTYNGVDRIDSAKGYIISNVRPCCKHCNYLKSSLSEEEFVRLIIHMYRIALHMPIELPADTSVDALDFLSLGIKMRNMKWD